MDTGTVCRLKGTGEYIIAIYGHIPIENTYDVVLYYGEHRVASYHFDFTRENYHVIHLPFAENLSIQLIRRSGREANVQVRVYKKLLFFWRRIL